MLNEATCLVGVSSTLVVQHDLVNYRWLFYSPETSMSVVIARAPLLQQGGATARPQRYSQVQILYLPSTPQSIALHRPTCRLAVACVDGTALLFNPGQPSPSSSSPVRNLVCDDSSLIWHTQATWRCEPGMTTPLKWCESNEDVWLVGAGTKVSMWKVVDDAVSVYSNRSFALGHATSSRAVLFDACSTGRYVATTTHPHARLIKVWSLNTWTMEMTAPFCAFLGHLRAIHSIEWLRPEAESVLDNATLMTLDVGGSLTVWREDSNASTFGFLRVWVLDESCIRMCGSIDRRKSRFKTLLWELPSNDPAKPLKVWHTAIPDKTHHLYTHTMDRMHMKASKSVGFSSRAGATADTHDGEKFIQGNLALSKCSITYLLYTIHDNGDLGIWRLDCTMFLTSTPRVTQLCTTSDLDLVHAKPMHASVVDVFAPPPHNLPPLDISFTLLQCPSHDLHAVSLHVAPLPPSPSSTNPVEYSVTNKLVLSTGSTLHGIHSVVSGTPDSSMLVVRDRAGHAVVVECDAVSHPSIVLSNVLAVTVSQEASVVFYLRSSTPSSALALSCVGFKHQDDHVGDPPPCHTLWEDLLEMALPEHEPSDGEGGWALSCAKEDDVVDSATTSASHVFRLVAVSPHGGVWLWRVQAESAGRGPRVLGTASVPPPTALPRQSILLASFMPSSSSLFVTVGRLDPSSSVQFWHITTSDGDRLDWRSSSSRAPMLVPSTAVVRRVELHRSGFLALLSSLDEHAAPKKEAWMSVQHMWDPRAVSHWAVDADMQCMTWQHDGSQLVAISPTAVYGFNAAHGTLLFSHSWLSPGVRGGGAPPPTSICMSVDPSIMYVAHGAFLSQVHAAPPPPASSFSSPPSPFSVQSYQHPVWTPWNLLHLLLDGRVKATRRVLQALVDAISINEAQTFVDMATSTLVLPWLPWSHVMYPREVDGDDRVTFVAKKPQRSQCTAANLFAPATRLDRRNSTPNQTLEDVVDVGAFFNVPNNHARLSFLLERDRSAFQTICSVVAACEQHATDMPGLRFLILAAVAEGGDGRGMMCAEAVIWARLTSMDLFALPMFQHGGDNSMDWHRMQKLRVPFWLDDIARLKQTTERMANRAYAATKDPFAVALYFVLLGKTRLLSNVFRLAHETKIADLLANDFDDDRWKAAAIKNAFVLKSKQRYLLAAAFFLLANKVYEAASIAELADPSFALSFLILRLSEPTSLTDLGPVTIQFVRTVLLDKAEVANDVYMQCLCRLYLDNRLVLEPFLAPPPPVATMTSASMMSNTYWQHESLAGACRLVQHGAAGIDNEADEARVVALHCMAATRLHAQGYGFLGHRLLSDLSIVFPSVTSLDVFPWVANLRHELARLCVSDQLQTVCSTLSLAIDTSIASGSFDWDWQTRMVEASSFFSPDVPPPAVVQLCRRHSSVAWMIASHHHLQTASAPIAAQVGVIIRAMQASPGTSSVVRPVGHATQSLIEYLHVMQTHESPDVVRLATGAIYTGMFALFVAVAWHRRLPRCCVVRFVSLLCPQKEILVSPQHDDMCLVCIEFTNPRRRRRQLLPSLRQDLPALHDMVRQLRTLNPPPLSSSLPSSSATDGGCWCWTALVALLHETMAAHVLRLTDQLDNAQSLQHTWQAYTTPRIVRQLRACRKQAATPSSDHGDDDDGCVWQDLIQLVVPNTTAVPRVGIVASEYDDGGVRGGGGVAEVIYSSDVPGESIRSMCCNTQQRSTVVLCNGRMLYRALAKKPPKTSNITSSCQLHVNAKYTPPAVFFAGGHHHDGHVKVPSMLLSPQPDSKGSSSSSNSSYKPVAVQSHPSMPVFCSGTATGSVEVWRFDQISTCNLFEHQVSTATNALTLAPRRDIHRLRFAQSGYTLGACDALGFVYLWNFASEGSSACYAHLQCHNRGTRDFAFLNASSCVASVGASTKKKNLCLWDTLLPPHKALICAPLCHPVGAASVVFSSRHQLVISGGESGSLSIFDVRQQRVLYAVSTAHDSCVTTLALHPQGHCVLSGSATGDVKASNLLANPSLSSYPMENVS
ncbi:hypothetical protein, variant 7 [Aphanomyces astaci]|uniref:RAVE complex protein Rav1 C-terminal domain-containing protein n=1 Tax=Aphanomyces astaci TaxID=112090 RepID=W4GJJ9_APHAT|nr:hypothetical protein, variant 6 [Aphanomyces astaci]XP_009831795.1 hypothetical protein, variant 7 [Aphanomyces astaci]ETV79068.1 hypothetical protein, variant 6 [Aphanomyces astaci]ETV79069.1 hypothetical protein, variant 7 [Aphanomyces astaci]|eukprot:XP_009831794.1 hypothetical protein, variant 6 [Aphanomyces astaci]